MGALVDTLKRMASATAANSAYDELNEINEITPERQNKPAPLDDSEERAAIIEEGAGVPREWAEGFATLCVMARPESVPPHRWRRLIDNAGRFIDHFAVQAHGLGWDAASVFGCHPLKPDARLDMQGLIWLVGAGELVAIADTSARIRTGTGTILTYCRRPRDAREPMVMAWEL